MSKFMLGTNEMPEIVVKDVSKLKNWEFNPRTVKTQDMERLIEQIKLLGVYKPLLINQDDIVLGGNMRLQALKKMGVKKMLCSLVRTDNAAQMMDYALSDNDQIGVTDEQAVAEYIFQHKDVNTKLFAINSSPMKLVSTMLKELEPTEDDKPLAAPEFIIKIVVKNKETLENLLVEVQEVSEHYGKDVKGISVNDKD